VFAFNGGGGSQPLQPSNEKGSCLTVKGNVLDVAACNAGDDKQSFSFGGNGAAQNPNRGGASKPAATPAGGNAPATNAGGKAPATQAGTTAPATTSAAAQAPATTAAADKPAGERGGRPFGRPSRTRVGAQNPDTTAAAGDQGKSTSSKCVLTRTVRATASPAAEPEGSKTAVVRAKTNTRGQGRKNTRRPGAGGGAATSGAEAEATSTAADTGAEATSTQAQEASSSAEVTLTSEATRPTGVTNGAAEPDISDVASSGAPAATGKVKAIPNPSSAVPVSRAGGTLNPTSAAQANARDAGATRAFENVEIRAPNGQCLFVDPTAGDFRQNLIPVSLVDCSGTPNEKWDVITKGKHNDAQGSAIIVSTLMSGCISLDERRQAGDTVTMFSCGGRADGGE
jgi:hypothetical protein